VEGLIEDLTRGNVAEVKAVLATVLVVGAGYQVGMATVMYGKLNPRGLGARVAGRAHRAFGDSLLVVLAAVSVMCLGVHGLEGFGEGGSEAVHSAAGLAVLVAIMVKVGILRGPGRGSGALPWLGGSVAALLLLAALTTVPGVLGAG
jgi:hypothetical protein